VDEARAVLDVLNGWADADLDKIRAEHAALTAQVLPRLPLVLPRRRHRCPHDPA
jgi:hypothetical protein